MHVPLLVEGAQPVHDLSADKLHNVLGEPLELLEYLVELTALNEGHHKV